MKLKRIIIPMVATVMLSVTAVSAARVNLSCRGTYTGGYGYVKADCALKTLHSTARFTSNTDAYALRGFLTNDETGESRSMSVFASKRDNKCDIVVYQYYYAVKHTHQTELVMY